MERPLISVICAVRNDARFIRETLESVVAQNYPRWELIIMDGASTDGTVAIIKEFAARYPNIIYRSEPDKGQWDALDKALALAKGELIAQVCGQDGYLNKNWFSRCAQMFEEQQDISLVWGVPFDMSENGKLIGPHYAYASFLKDADYKFRAKPFQTIAAKIDLQRPSALERWWRLMKKITPRRILMVLKSFVPAAIPQKEQWFSYWLKTTRAFPEGNMVVRKEVYTRLTTRFPQETMTNAALLNFCFDFNAKGYLSYGLPLAANFSRSHAVGQALREHDARLTAEYKKRVSDFAQELHQREKVMFVDGGGRPAFEKKTAELI